VRAGVERALDPIAAVPRDANERDRLGRADRLQDRLRERGVDGRVLLVDEEPVETRVRELLRAERAPERHEGAERRLAGAQQLLHPIRPHRYPLAAVAARRPTSRYAAITRPSASTSARYSSIVRERTGSGSFTRKPVAPGASAASV